MPSIQWRHLVPSMVHPLVAQKGTKQTAMQRPWLWYKTALQH